MAYGTSCMQGWRISMEDGHTALLSLGDNDENSFFAVFDGHGGANIAHYCESKLHLNLVALPAYQQKNYSQALTQAFLRADEELRAGEWKSYGTCTM